MSKNAQQAIDPLSLAKPLEKPKANDAPVFSAGHQCVIDQSVEGRLSLHVPTGEEAFANLWSAATKVKDKQPAKYLAKTDGHFGSVSVDIGGKRCYVKLTVQVAE